MTPNLKKSIDSSTKKIKLISVKSQNLSYKWNIDQELERDEQIKRLNESFFETGFSVEKCIMNNKEMSICLTSSN